MEMKFKVGDRVACYDKNRGKGTVKDIDADLIFVQYDFKNYKHGNWFHHKQCRRLVKKKDKDINSQSYFGICKNLDGIEQRLDKLKRNDRLIANAFKHYEVKLEKLDNKIDHLNEAYQLNSDCYDVIKERLEKIESKPCPVCYVFSKIYRAMPFKCDYCK